MCTRQQQLTVLADDAEVATGKGARQVALVVEVLCLLVRLPGVPITVPPPDASTHSGLPTAGLSRRVLERVRGLLAKAESTEFDHEAEALTAKAQELIARHAVDEALLHSVDDVGDPSVRRLPVTDPYADAKAALLTAVADANRCRVVYIPDVGWVTVFGYDHDLDALEVLAASLLAQATGAMARHGSRRDPAGRSTTRSFWFGFAHRIGQRLGEATDDQTTATIGGEHDRLLPVLWARDERRRAAERAAFPKVARHTGSNSNGAGWSAGQAAADLAEVDVSAGALRDTDAGAEPPLVLRQPPGEVICRRRAEVSGSCSCCGHRVPTAVADALRCPAPVTAAVTQSRQPARGAHEAPRRAGDPAPPRGVRLAQPRDAATKYRGCTAAGAGC